MAGRPRFLCGVVEGFYGRPWSMEQRKLLFQWLKHRGLNCYMYAPKDELKHRLLWREPYTEHEPACGLSSKLPKSRVWSLFSPFLLARTWCSQVLGIGSCCSKNSGRGASSLCPCLQVAAMGCHSFALLFDDIDPCMCQADRDVFPSLAQAQASVANEVYQELGQPSVFLFCPTEYCSSLCSPSPRQSCYLLTIGQELLPGIGIIWTGPKVVSQELSAALLEEVEGVLRRPPVIWDNLYANDYDCRRVFLGPYTGRAPGLVPRLCGLLLNPNCELQANFIPIHTLGSWFRSELGSGAHPDLTGTETTAALGDSQGPQEGSYSPQEALELALRDWVAEINRQALEQAGSVQSTGTPGATETLHSPGPTMCCSNGTTSQDLPLPTGGARMGGGSPCQPPSGTQPEASRAEMPQTPPGLGAGASPGPTAPFTDGAGTNPGPTAPLTDGAGASPGPTAPLTDGAGASPGPMAPVILEEAGSSPVALLTLEEAVSGPTVPLTPKEGRTSSTAPLTLEEAGSVPVALLTLEEATSSSTAPVSPEEDTSSPMALLTLAEVQMLVELFYLPYHHGPLAQHLLEHFRWLWANSLSVGVPAPAADACEGTQWRGRAQSFQLLCAQTCRLHSRFVSSAGRALLYDLHPYLWDIRNMLLAASALVLWLDGHLLCDPDPKGTWGSCFGWCQSITAPIPLRGDAEPWARRGGLFGELQALLPVGNSCDLFYHPPPLFPSSQLYVLRPLLPLDKGELYRMCQESLDCDPEVAEILAAHPDLLGDRLLGSFLSLSPEYTFVLEDEEGPCGYAAGALCAEGFLQQRDSSWLPAVRHKYPRDLGAGAPALGQDALEEALLFFHAEPPAVPLPVLRRFPSLVQLGTAPRVLDVGASRSLAICLLSALRANGSRGVFCQVSAADRQQLSFYGKLGFVALPVAWSSSPGAQLLGRLL
ncbi:protein O-GlcNAcase-like isoform X7 [Athene noctua]|uniref:protein O-GlcNAcase-like isoform X7 n=1 Tax=Athene noctua TaxID=126797 RepID=UPI003EB84F9B